MTASETPHRILTRHFLRRFLDNDLISPDADRSQVLALVGAGCFCTTLFITVALSCFKYVIGIHTPGQAAVASLDDKVFYIGLSMLVAALVAASQWDALSVDARDASVLEPLPLTVATIRRAKLAATAILGLGTALLVNGAPTVLFPILLVIKQRVGLLDVLALYLTHAVVAMLAATFGFVAIAACRGGLAAVLGERVFTCVSPMVQGTLLMLLGCSLLLLPGAATRVEQRALTTEAALLPPIWFLGMYEVAAGSVVVDAQRGPLVPRLIEADRVATARYKAHHDQFRQLAMRALLGLATVFAVAGLAYTRQSRQLTPATLRETTRRSRLHALSRLATGRSAPVAAGFHFADAVLWRNRTHRLTLAAAAAVGLALVIIALSRVDLSALAGGAPLPPRLLAIQPLLYGALLVGFRHAVRVPAELRANWVFQMAWRGRTQHYLAGVRRVAVLALVLPALAIVFLATALVAGPSTALLHALAGFAGALLLLEVLLFGYDKVPFICTYVPDENMKALGPLYLLMFLVGAATFARLEARVIQSVPGTLLLAAVLIAASLVVRLVSNRRAFPGPMVFDEGPEAMQRLGLHT